MADIKANMVDSYLNRPDPKHRVILIYGQDIGLITERAEQITKTYLADNNDPFALLRLDAGEITSDPLRLADEANTISMFGGCRVILVHLSGNKSIVPALEPVLSSPPSDAYIVIKAGDLKKSAPVRKTIEKAQSAVALPCYVDARDALNKIIDEELGQTNLGISNDARMMLLDNLGADRMASRGEIQKLCLYAMGQETISEDDIENIVGDASNHQIDMIIDSAALGDIDQLDHQLEQILGSGQSSSVIATASLRHFQMLERCVNMMDSGTPAQSALQKAGPMIHFKRKARVQNQLRLWSSKKAARACELLATALSNSRKNYHLADTIISETLLMIAATARKSHR
ncbi:DNA polymerase III subunit delta [Cohaesibacter gelatinilyticus]|uniref:DNA polymerase III subunit delta n=1 Tax=Cohaesibacter gelatinilyticus TaxID=372072 RepID=A0A285PF08_9HYPH|nr:DNA polymerase III subunit delta [Cohaesibacter gelatinilyticus]SNZ19883.1 DNA polymerase III, delta subunit [Cohaesibacter gelatinilyticus]